ncbi:hypothetical protein QBC37DRAFT_448415 [Rhypophila decipiens]|uniref:Uncharacterized protein n=1 Tax=Rhypophila decipiens TaxID=261697 RepID=A0AAN6Y0U2_9PEZI|nr:hypothetical protein QBC37DRAFT_448415 [Rhypophila decipiens]
MFGVGLYRGSSGGLVHLSTFQNPPPHIQGRFIERFCTHITQALHSMNVTTRTSRTLYRYRLSADYFPFDWARENSSTRLQETPWVANVTIFWENPRTFDQVDLNWTHHFQAGLGLVDRRSRVDNALWFANERIQMHQRKIRLDFVSEDQDGVHDWAVEITVSSRDPEAVFIGTGHSMITRFLTTNNLARVQAFVTSPGNHMGPKILAIYPALNLFPPTDVCGHRQDLSHGETLIIRSWFTFPMSPTWSRGTLIGQYSVQALMILRRISRQLQSAKSDRDRLLFPHLDILIRTLDHYMNTGSITLDEDLSREETRIFNGRLRTYIRCSMKSRYYQSIIHLLFLHLLVPTLVPVVQAAPSTARSLLNTILSPRQTETPLEAPTDLRWECQWKNHSALACDGLGTWYGTESVWRQCDVIIEPYVTKVCAGYTKCFSPEPGLQLCARWPEDYCPYPDEIVIELEPERVRRMTSARGSLLDGHGAVVARRRVMCGNLLVRQIMSRQNVQIDTASFSKPPPWLFFNS